MLQDAKGSRSRVYSPRGGGRRDRSRFRISDGNPTARTAPGLAPGRIGQAASFDGKSFIQFDGDIAGFDSYGSGRGALGANDPTVTYDDAYTMAAWIYPTAPSGAIVTRDEDICRAQRTRAEPERRTGSSTTTSPSGWTKASGCGPRRPISLNQWHHVALTYSGSRWASGVKIYVDGEDQKLEILIDDFNSQGAVKREPLRIGAGGGPENRFHGSIDDVRIYKRALSPAEAGILADLTPVTAIAALPEDKRTAAQADKIRDYFLEHALPANIAEARDAVDGCADKAGCVLSKPSHRHGDGGNADAARDAPVDPRDVRQTRRGRHATVCRPRWRRRRTRIRRIGWAWRGGWSIRRIR